MSKIKKWIRSSMIPVVRGIASLRIRKMKLPKPLSKLLHFLLKDSSLVVEINGYKMFLDPDDFLQISIWGNYEPDETIVFSREVKPGSRVVDVGANIGYYTLLGARLVGDNGIVYAFEPDPLFFRILAKNVEINGFKNVVLVNRAVSDIGTTSGSHEPGTTSLDQYFGEDNSKIDLVKIDVEGAEGKVLRG